LYNKSYTWLDPAVFENFAAISNPLINPALDKISWGFIILVRLLHCSLVAAPNQYSHGRRKAMTRTQDIKKGDVIFREGNFSDTAFIIESGLFEVTKKTEDGGYKKISTLQKNDIFGEMGIIDGLPRSATVTALEDGKVTVVTKEDFQALAKRNPNALMPILKILSMRLRKALKREAKWSSSVPDPDSFNSIQPGK